MSQFRFEICLGDVEVWRREPFEQLSMCDPMAIPARLMGRLHMSFKVEKLLSSSWSLSAELKGPYATSVHWSLHLYKLVCVSVSDILDI